MRRNCPENISFRVLPAVAFLCAFLALPVYADGIPTLPLFTYTGDALPSAADGWEKGYDYFESTGARIENGVLHITDLYTWGGSAINYWKAWDELTGYVNVAEFDVKAVACGGISYDDWPPGYVAIYFGTSDGNHNMLYTLYPDHILSSYADSAPGGSKIYVLGETYPVDTASQFNTYKAVIEGGTARLYMNGALVMEQKAGRGIYDVHGVQFGSGSSPGTGEAYFDGVRAYRQAASADIRLTVAPRALNLRSNGQWISAYLEAPAGYNVSGINQSTVMLQGSLPPVPGMSETGDFDGDGTPELMIKFDRPALQSLLGTGDAAEITITGEFDNGTPFLGRDTIKVNR